MKRKNVTILAGMILSFVFLTGCGIKGTDYLAQSNNNSNTGSSASETEEQLQSKIDALQSELDSLKQSQNTQNSGQTSGQDSGQTSGQDSGTASNNTQSNTQTTDNSQNAGTFSTGGNSGAAAANVQISLEEATRIALERVPGATEQNISIHLDFDDGWYVYEGDIIYNRMEYEFDIDANTGTILKWEQERW